MLKNIGQAGAAAGILAAGALAYQEPAAVAAPATACVALPASAPASSAPASSPSATPASSDSASPAASASSSAPVQLCVSVQPAQFNVARGQSAKFNVQVSEQNGTTPDVKLTISASGGLPAAFAAQCPSGNGSDKCDLGQLGASGTPSTFQLSASVAVPASATSVSSLTLSATASALSSPATAVNEANTMPVVAPPPPPPPPKPSSHPGQSSPPAKPGKTAPPSPPPAPQGGGGGIPTIGPIPGVTVPIQPVAPVSVGASTIGAGDVGGLLPTVAPDPTPSPEIATPAPTGPLSSAGLAAVPSGHGATTDSAADTALGMRAATAAVLAYIAIALAALLAATRISAWQRLRTSRRPKHAKPTQAAATAPENPGSPRAPWENAGKQPEGTATSEAETITLDSPQADGNPKPPSGRFEPGHFLG